MLVMQYIELFMWLYTCYQNVISQGLTKFNADLPLES